MQALEYCSFVFDDACIDMPIDMRRDAICGARVMGLIAHRHGLQIESPRSNDSI